jgi:transcriptional regulator of acetoin/glycerol metabolism
VQQLVKHRWPGNIRELRNFMERVVILANSQSDVLSAFEPEPIAAVSSEESQIDLSLPYKEAKMIWIDKFEMAYVSELLKRNEGNVAAAAREAGVDRTYFFRLIRKYDLKK